MTDKTNLSPEIQAAIEANTPANFKLFTDADFANAEPTSWIVKGVIPDGGIGAMFGPSGTFKSFLALDMMAHVADGRPWMDKRVKKTSCVYVPFEGRGGVPKRVEAWRLATVMDRLTPNPDYRLGTSHLPYIVDFGITTGIQFIMEPLSLLEPQDLDRLTKTLRDAGLTGCLICIDTLAQASAGLDENSSDMAKVLSVIQRLQHELSCTVIVIHHTGKDETRGMRGWSGVHAAMDFEMECQRDDSSTKTGVIWLKKVKDGEDGVPLSNFAMRVVQLGPDEDGDLRTSLVVEQVTAEQAQAAKNDADAPLIDQIVQLITELTAADQNVPVATKGRYTVHKTLSARSGFPGGLTPGRTNSLVTEAAKQLTPLKRLLPLND
jgi:hypothetical protein